MNEPEFDKDGYPTETTLKAIKAWPIKSFSDVEALLDFVGRAWSYPDRWVKAPRRFRYFGQLRRRYTVSTGGWSGNESLITALESTLAWHISWRSSRRGGHYVLEVPQDDDPARSS